MTSLFEGLTVLVNTDQPTSCLPAVVDGKVDQNRMMNLEFRSSELTSLVPHWLLFQSLYWASVSPPR